MIAAIFNLNHPAHTVHWHFFLMTVSNIVVIVVMLVVFAVAVLAAVSGPQPEEGREMSGSAKRSWTAAARERAVGALPPEKLLPDSQPAYMASWIYIFGVLSLVSLMVIIASGSILGLKGPGWWHFTGVGHFFNSIHLWSVELFFFFMVIHLWGKYWMAAWRGGRARVWMTGAVTFVVAIPCADRLCLPAELRRAVDLDAGQGRDERRRGRRVLQRHELRSDVQLPRAAAPAGGRRAGRRAHPAGPQARNRAAVSPVRSRRPPGLRAGPASGCARGLGRNERRSGVPSGL